MVYKERAASTSDNYVYLKSFVKTVNVSWCRAELHETFCRRNNQWHSTTASISKHWWIKWSLISSWQVSRYTEWVTLWFTPMWLMSAPTIVPLCLVAQPKFSRCLYDFPRQMINYGFSACEYTFRRIPVRAEWQFELTLRSDEPWDGCARNEVALIIAWSSDQSRMDMQVGVESHKCSAQRPKSEMKKNNSNIVTRFVMGTEKRGASWRCPTIAWVLYEVSGTP